MKISRQSLAKIYESSRFDSAGLRYTNSDEQKTAKVVEHVVTSYFCFSVLQRAFVYLKNQIGMGWKDLVRTLPYEPQRDMNEINNEIKAIEYDNQGQLKEQAYQVPLLSKSNTYCHLLDQSLKNPGHF